MANTFVSIILLLLVTFVVHPLPIIVYRYFIRKAPLEASKSFLVALADSLIVLGVWTIINVPINFYALGFWAVFSYTILTPKQSIKLTTRELATVAILSAIAAVLFMIEIPVVLFYKLDLSSLPVLLGAFAMGPIPGTLILLVKALLGLLHTTSQGVGELADFIMGFAMMLPAAVIYRRMKSRKGAIVGMIAGSVIATVVAVLTNLYIMIPFYGTAYGMPIEAIVGMGQAIVPFVDNQYKFVLAITAPFNVLKWVVISVVTGLIYKPLSPILHGRKKSGAEVKKF